MDHACSWIKHSQAGAAMHCISTRSFTFPQGQQRGSNLEILAAEVVQKRLQQILIASPLQPRPQILADLTVELQRG